MPRYQSPTPEAFKQVTTEAGHLSSLFVLNVAVAKRWIWIIDGPDAAGVLLFGPVPLEPGQPFALDEENGGGLDFNNGLYIASSTAVPPAFAASVGLDLYINAWRRKVGY